MAALAGVLAVWGCNMGVDARTGATPRVARPVVIPEDLTIELTGSGLGAPTVFTFEQLARMEMTRLDNVLMQKSHGPDETTAWQGPALDALLSAAHIKPGPTTFDLEAVDGYRMRCTRHELHSAILALRDGQGRWLSDLDKSCPLRLVPPHMPGNYWIMNLSRITVEPVQNPQGSP